MMAVMDRGFKCKLCRVCNGKGCIGELPGMGGVFDSSVFIENCAAWKKYFTEDLTALPKVRLAPIAGGIQNVGYGDEKQFYFDLIQASVNAGLALSIGDGHPDEKLFFALDALKTHKKKAAVFLKPYPQHKLFKRIEAAIDSAEIFGVDIDSYNIVTMRNLVNLEKKTAADLRALKKRAKTPFAVKGIFTQEGIELIKELKPDITVISNHGGRIETEKGSTADFAARHAKELSRFTGEVWADGGLRTREDLAAAASLSITEVLLGRPCITGLLRDKENGIKEMLEKITGGNGLAAASGNAGSKK